MTNTENKIHFTGKSLRAEKDLKRMIEQAKWDVDYYRKEVQKAHDTLYRREIALESLENELNTLRSVSQL